MSQREGRPARRPVQPSLSHRTLQHPSFLPLYMSAGFGHPHRNCNQQTGHSIIPAEFYYTDPTMDCGMRIPNAVTDLSVLECLQLNTPPPVMSTRLAGPYCPDPFTSGPHPTRNLGSPTWSMPPYHCRVQPSHVVLQLSQEEDLAVTNLLKLHHQNPSLSTEAFSAVKMDFSSAVWSLQDASSRLLHHRPADPTSVYQPMCSDVQCLEQESGAWSDTELEAANTLLSRFVLSEEDQGDQSLIETHPDSLPHERSSSYADAQCGSEAVPALVSTAPTQNNTGFGCVRGPEEPSWQDVASADDGLVSGGFPEVKGQPLSD